VAAGAGVIVLAAWFWWAAYATVAFYETSAAARIELDSATYVLQSPLLGRIVSSELRTGEGRAVHRGDILVQLDAAPEELRLREEQARAAAIEPEIAGLQRRLQAEERARAEERRAAVSSTEEARGRLRAAQADARYAEAELARTQALQERRLLTQRELEKAGLDAERSAATTMTLAAAAERVSQEQTVKEHERDVQIAQLRAELATRQMQQLTFAASIERLRYEIERHRIRAPVDGVIAESAILRPGSVVDEGDRLASIMSPGRLIVVAQFPPRAVLGRIRAGQPAVLRLDGFAWAEFGAVSATVSHVAREARDGLVRVELTIDSRSTFRGALEHGMPGSVEITVEHLTPLALLLRTVGQALTATA
jgi:multidrug resistance efflux pump